MQKHTIKIEHQNGFSMIEVLITMVIISIALLGSAGLQAYALKTNQGGQFRNQAAFLVGDIVERMQTNKSYSVNATTYYGDANSIAPSTTDCAATTCSAPLLAAYDITNWQNAISAVLPQGTGAITGVPGNPASYTVVVNWVDRKTNTNYTAASATAVTEPFSITTNIMIGR